MAEPDLMAFFVIGFGCGATCALIGVWLRAKIRELIDGRRA